MAHINGANYNHMFGSLKILRFHRVDSGSIWIRIMDDGSLYTTYKTTHRFKTIFASFQPQIYFDFLQISQISSASVYWHGKARSDSEGRSLWLIYINPFTWQWQPARVLLATETCTIALLQGYQMHTSLCQTTWRQKSSNKLIF